MTSNRYWGWGGEDDDMSKRVTGSGLKITRYPVDIARYIYTNYILYIYTKYIFHNVYSAFRKV